MSLGILTLLTTLFGSNDNDRPTGADAVKQAVHEFEDLVDTTFEATLGEPDIEEGGGSFINQPRVVIPIHGTPCGDAGSLAFDLDSIEDGPLGELLNIFGISIDQIEELEGETVPIFYAGGNAVVDWAALEGVVEEAVDEWTGGSEEDPHSEEDIEDLLAEPPEEAEDSPIPDDEPPTVAETEEVEIGDGGNEGDDVL